MDYWMDELRSEYEDIFLPVYIVTSKTIARREAEHKKTLEEARTINNGILKKLLKHNLKLEMLVKKYCPREILRNEGKK